MKHYLFGISAILGSALLPAFGQEAFYREGDRVFEFTTGADGRITMMKHGEVVTRLDRDANGFLTGLHLPSGHRFDLIYDEIGRLASRQDLTYGMLLTFTYDPLHQRPIIYKRNNDPDLILRLALDAQGNLSEVTTREGRTESLTWTSDGQPLLLTGANGTARLYTFNGRGLLTKIEEGTGADERETQMTYDPAGRVQSFTDAEGQVTTYGYLSSGELGSITESDGTLSTIEEDGNQNPIALHRPDGAGGTVSHRWTYDGLQRMRSYQPPGLAAIDYHYDVYSNPVAWGGSTFQWNDRNQMTLESHAQPTAAPLTVSSTYDDAATGLPTASVTSDGITLMPTYRGEYVRQLAWSGAIAGTFEIDVDPCYRITSNAVNGETPFIYTYDKDDLMLTAGALTYTRDAQTGWITGSSIGNVDEVFRQNAFGDLISHTVTSGGTTLYSVTHTRDKLGRLTESSETVEGVTVVIGYRYDRAGRLEEVMRDGAVTESYSYDARGNLIGDQLHASYTYNEADQLLNAGAASFNYTSTGERLTKKDGAAETTYHYTTTSLLRGVDLPDGREVRYLHDGATNLAGKEIDGIRIAGYLSPLDNRPIATLNPDGDLKTRMVYGTYNGSPAYLVRGTEVYRLVSDSIGSVRMVVDVANGQIMQRLRYDAYGLTLEDTSPGFQPFGFTGGWTDPDTGLIRIGARDYDPRTRCWTTMDPIQFGSGSLNHYAYVSGDPVNRVDPSGLGEEEINRKVASVVSMEGDQVIWIQRAGWHKRWVRGHVNDPISIGDRIKTSDKSMTTIQFDIGGQAGINIGTIVEIVTPRNARAIGNRFLINAGTIWAKIDKRQNALQIQTAGGVIGIEG